MPPGLAADLANDFEMHPLEDGADVTALAARHPIRALLTSTLVGADGDLIAALPDLEVIVNSGGHVDLIDLKAAAARGIPVTHTPDVFMDDVADLAYTLLLAVVRRLGLGLDVHAKRLGIIGLGKIGRAVAARASGFDLAIAYHGRRPQDVPWPYFVELTDLARNVDFLMVCCTSTPETRHLVNAAVLDALGPRGILINVARGPVVDEAALVRALGQGRIAGAGLDVFEDEPLVPGALTSFDNVVLTPHMASRTKEVRRVQATVVMANLRAHFDGGPLPNRVPETALAGH